MSTPCLILQTLRRCVQKSGSSAFGSMDPFSLVEFLVVRLKGAAHRDWMTSRPALRQALETGCLELPSLLDVVGQSCWCVATRCGIHEGDFSGQFWGQFDG